MCFANGNVEITDQEMREAISLVNCQGYAALALPAQVELSLGRTLYKAMDAQTFHPHRQRYYNEIAFFWPDDWLDVESGVGAFHEQKSLPYIMPVEEARKLLNEKLGAMHAEAILNFALQLKQLVIHNHHGLENNELRLARVMVRQMNETDHTSHSGADLHEDVGYSDRPYSQLLSVIVTTHGITTESKIYQPKVGELLVFNAYDRRKRLGLDESFAFLHKGPRTGPKMFFFFEFLGRRIEADQN